MVSSEQNRSLAKDKSHSKPRLTLLHGWGVNQHIFELIKPELSPFFDLTLVDLPGFGSNSQIELDFSSLDEIASCLQQQAIDCDIIAGWSLGGMVATRMCSQQPDKFAQLGLIASSPCFVERDNWRGMQNSVLTQFEQDLSRDIDKTITRFLAIQSMGCDSARQDTKLIRNLMASSATPSPQALAGGLDILHHQDLRNELASLKIPVKAVVGRLDALVPQQSIHSLSSIAEIKVIDKASHAPFISHKAEFVTAMRELFVEKTL